MPTDHADASSGRSGRAGEHVYYVSSMTIRSRFKRGKGVPCSVRSQGASACRCPQRRHDNRISRSASSKIIVARTSRRVRLRCPLWWGWLEVGWKLAGGWAERPGERDGFRAHETSTSGVSAPRASRLWSCQVSQSDTRRESLASLSKARRRKRTVLPLGDSFQAKASGQGGAGVGPNGQYLYFHCASWLARPLIKGVPDGLERAFSCAAAKRPRPPWLDTGGTRQVGLQVREPSPLNGWPVTTAAQACQWKVPVSGTMQYVPGFGGWGRAAPSTPLAASCPDLLLPRQADHALATAIRICARSKSESLRSVWSPIACLAGSERWRPFQRPSQPQTRSASGRVLFVVLDDDAGDEAVSAVSAVFWPGWRPPPNLARRECSYNWTCDRARPA